MRSLDGPRNFNKSELVCGDLVLSDREIGLILKVRVVYPIAIVTLLMFRYNRGVVSRGLNLRPEDPKMYFPETRKIEIENL